MTTTKRQNRPKKKKKESSAINFSHIRDGRRNKIKFRRVFLTRGQASRKLQVPIKDFRRLCILKGVYPRHVKKVPTASKQAGVSPNAQFFFTKDVNWMREDAVLKKIFRYDYFQKQIKKFVGRGDLDKALAFKERAKPQYSLVHCVRERYPTFIEAVREVDDAVSHVALYAQLPPLTTSETTIEGHWYHTTGMAQKSKALMERWDAYIARSHGLRKAFISVKGYYFQADVIGHPVTWLVPHYYTTKMSKRVDFSVMFTFLEIYVVMLDFVLFRLEHDLEVKLAGEATASKEAEEVEAQAQETFAEDFPMSAEERAERDKQQGTSTLFKGLKFCIGREVPQAPFLLICRSLGAEITESPEDMDITHQIIDRPTVADPVPNRDYVQPQWVVDCLNCSHLLPVDQYMPGKPLPPHLSPFEEGLVLDHEGRPYEPERLRELKRIMDPTYHALAARLGGGDAPAEPAAAASDPDSDTASEAESEQGNASIPHDGVVTDEDEEEEEKGSAGPAKRQPQKEPKPAKRKGAQALQLAAQRHKEREMEEKRLRASMLSNKKRKLWERIQNNHKRRDQKVAALDKRRQLLNAGKLVVDATGALVDRKEQALDPMRKTRRPQGKGKGRKG